MKTILLKSMLFASILLVATSCNDDDDDDNGPAPAPAFSFTGEVIDPTNGETSTWTANSVNAEVDLFGELSIEAVSGDDTLSILVPSLEERPYAIDLNDPLAYGNYYISVGSSDTTIYTFSTDPASTTAGVLTITELDTINNRFNATYQIAFYNPADQNDFFILQNAVLENIPYTEEEFDFGGFGDGTMSFSANGQSYTIDNAVGAVTQGTLSLDAISLPNFAPGVNLTMNADITTGAYSIGDASAEISGSVTLADLFDAFGSTSGDLVITAHDTDNKNIQGTFSFTGVNVFDDSETVQVTDGSFNVNYN